MWKSIAAAVFALLCCLSSGSAAAGDAEVRYVITNGGVDVQGHGQVTYFPAGKHDGPSVTWAGSGDSARMPEGNYSVHVTFSDGAAKKEMWLDDLHFTGKVEKTVEVAVPITEVRYVITNGGTDVQGRGQVIYFPAGKHDGPSVTWAGSGDSARMPEGIYSVHVTFSDGAAKKEMWLDDLHFSGKVEKTVEVAVPITQVRYVITNGGVDVQGRGQVTYFPAGKHDGPSVTWAGSGDSVRMPEGTYSVHVTFADGAAHKDLWIDDQAFLSKVEKTVEVAVPITEVRYVITNGGNDVQGHGQVTYFAAGKHDGPSITWAGSGDGVRMPEGSYDVHVTFSDGDAHKEFWIDNQAFSGKVERTVEIGVAITEVRYVITNGGADTEGKGQVHYSRVGKHNEIITWANSGGAVRLPEGSYDVHVTFSDGDAHKEFWIDNQAFSGKVEKTVEIGVAITEVRYLITNGGVDTEDKGQVHYSPVGKHNDTITWANSGGTVRLPEGSYDVYVTFSDGDAHKDKWITNQIFSGKVERTVEIGQPVTEVHYLITNGGNDVEDKGQVHYFPVGKHDSGITWSNSGGTVRLPEGNYDVQVVFTDGLVRKEIWLNDQSFADTVNKTVELGITLAEPTVTVTQKGTDVGDQASVTYFAPSTDHDLGTVANNQAVVIEAGTYDIRARFDGAEGWLRHAAVTGSPHLTIEVQQPKTELKVTALRNGSPLPGASCGVYQPGETEGDPLAHGNSGEWQEVPPSTYDVGCSIDAGGVTQSAWLKDKTLEPGKTELTIDMPAPPSAAFALVAPAATPEQVSPDSGDFPYLPPLPDSKPMGGKAASAPVYVQLPDARQPELVATASIIKWYRAPGGVSIAALLAIYHEALLKAGWTIVNELHRIDAILTAHYGQNGRNIWAFIHFDNNGYNITVADATIALSKLAADLGNACHLALTGVLFDFDKSTLKPESDPVLEQVSAMMAKDPALRLEVQGHTDGIGSDAYNQPLSEARARSVVVWLNQHGVAVDRLSPHGYGKTKPIAPNSTDEGRARNRRVEIANLSCKAKGQGS